jgi:outer membrane protein TolC
METIRADNKYMKRPIMTALLKLIIVLFLSGLLYPASAQVTTKTMMPEISYPYLDTLIALAKQNYPRVRTFERRVAAQQQNLKKMKLGWLDVFTFSFLYSPNNSTTLINPSILNGYQLGIFFNLGGLLKNKSMIGQAKEDLKVTEFERDEYYINLASLVKQRYFTYIQQFAILKVRQEAESDAESNMEMFKHKYEKGEVTLDDYNKSLVNLADRVQSKIESEGSVLVAKSSLEELVGKKLEDIR